MHRLHYLLFDSVHLYKINNIDWYLFQESYIIIRIQLQKPLDFTNLIPLIKPIK